jgi:hypothetical protein
MSSSSQASLQLVHRLVWLRVVLSDRFGPDVANRVRRRLLAYRARTGIAPVSSASRIALSCSSRSITPYDVSMVVAWLVEQPEVVLVFRERQPVAAHNNSAGRRVHG